MENFSCTQHSATERGETALSSCAQGCVKPPRPSAPVLDPHTLQLETLLPGAQLTRRTVL